MTKRNKRPAVIINPAEPESVATESVIEHVGQLGWEDETLQSRLIRVYVRGGELVQVLPSIEIEDEGRLLIRPLPKPLVRERVTQACALKKTRRNSKGNEVEVVTAPPGWLVDAIHLRWHFGELIRVLTGIIEAPTIRSDGSILQTPGYDAATGLLFDCNAEFPLVPESPSQEDVATALESLYHVICDFPFASDADRSVWVALVLSMIGRPCVDGCVPMFPVTANIRGSGKSMLFDAASIIAYGHRAARQTFASDDKEMGKVITSLAIQGTSSVLFDNLNVQLRGSALDTALTGTTWNDRILGESRMTGDLPMRIVFTATGNNLTYGTDIARRVVPIRLVSVLAEPEGRSDFVHRDLLGWVASERPRLAVAALTILRGFYAAGCPEQAGGEFGSFEAWSRIIRGAILWAGGADPLLTRESAKANDESSALLAKLLAGIELSDSGVGLTVKEIASVAEQGESEGADCLREAIAEVCGDRFNPKSFGKRLKSYEGRVFDGRCLKSEDARGGVKRWRVRTVDGGFSGYGGFENLDKNRTQEKQYDTQQPEGEYSSGEANPSKQPNQPPNGSGWNGSGGLDGLGSTQSDFDIDSAKSCGSAVEL